MSLICGILSRVDHALASQDALEAMLAVTRHRARDGHVTFLDPAAGVALAYCHTATFGHDKNIPSWHADDRVVAAVDGDIYDTAAHLQGRVSEYRSHHAGAVVENFRAGDGAFPADLDGVFSLFLWDRAQKTLHLSSDRLGRKLVYYFHDPDRDFLVFSTELKGVLAHPAVPRQLDEKALPLFLHQGMTSAPFSLAAGTKKLLPAECQSFGPSAPQSRHYWKPTLETGPGDFDYWVQRTRKETVNAAQRTIGNSDRVALYLSGGVDSSVIAAALSLGNTGAHTEAFTLVYKGHPGSDDLDWARSTAATTGIALHPVSVDPDDSVTPELMSTLLAQIDEPFFSANRILNEHFLIQAIQDAGFDSAINGLEGAPIGAAYRRAIATAGNDEGSVDRALRTYYESRISHGEKRIAEALVEVPDFSAIEAASLAYQDLFAGFTPIQAVHVSAMLRVSSSRYAAFYHYIPPFYGQEERSVFLDTKLASLWASFPAAFDSSSSRDMEKAIFKEAFRDLLPSGFDQREKRGFPGVPMPAWLKEMLVPSLQPLVEDGILKPKYLVWLDRNCKKDRPRAWDEAWKWFVFCCWYQFQIKQTDPFAGVR